MSNINNQIQQILEFMQSGREREIVPPLSLLIEIKEYEESFMTIRGYGQEEQFKRCWPVLQGLLTKYPLNGRNMDTRYEIRKTAVVLLSLFFKTVMCLDSDTIKSYIQVCFHVILTDSEEIAIHAYSTLKQYLELYEAKDAPPQLVSLSEFKPEIDCFVENYLSYVSNFAQSLIKRSDEVNEVARLLAKPLIPFAQMKQDVPSLPTQSEPEDLANSNPQRVLDFNGVGAEAGAAASSGQPGAPTPGVPDQIADSSAALDPNQPARMSSQMRVSLMQESQSSQSNTRKFNVYGSRSLKYGGELLSSLLCQTWEFSLYKKQPGVDLNSFRLIKQFSNAYLNVINNSLVILRTQQPFWTKDSSGPALKFFKCLTQIIHLMKNQIMCMVGNLPMSPFFEFIIDLLRNLPQHENLLRFLVLNQFNDIVFCLIFGGNQEIRADFQELVRSEFLNYVDRFLAESNNDMVLLTLKQVSHPVIQEQQLLLYRMYDLLQDKLEIEQICKIVSFLLHFTQHPLMTSANFKYRILSYVNSIIKSKFYQACLADRNLPQNVVERVHDLQMHSLYCITKVVKHLHEQTDQALAFFKQDKNGQVDLVNTVGESKKIKEAKQLRRNSDNGFPDLAPPMGSNKRQGNVDHPMQEEVKGSASHLAKPNRVENQASLPIDSIFVLQEQDIVDAYNDSFMVSWRTISQIEENRRTSSQKAEQQQVPQTSEKNLHLRKEWLIKAAKQAFFNFNIIQCWFYMSRKSFDLKANKLYKRFIIKACHLLQNLTEIMPNEEINLKHLSKLLKTIMTSYVNKVMQFRDILNACGEDLFGLCVEAKVKGLQFGVDYLCCRLLMNFEQNAQPSHNPGSNKQKLWSDQFTAHFLDAFFQYLKVKTDVFDVKNENEEEVPRCCLSKQDKRLAKLPFKDLQEAMQSLILHIGEQTLKHSNDTKVKHTFFSVFMFCMQKIRSGFIVPKYFDIIRLLLKEVMQTDEKDEKKEVMRDFMPIVQGLLETFLQAKDEATYVKETSEICCLMPAKIRNLLEQLPAISIPLIDSMQSRQSNTGIHTIQYWHVVLNQYPFLLDPILSKILPELNQSIQGTILPFMPHSMKLIGKLGAKSRLYEANNKFASRNFPEDGLKITLKDKDSKQMITFGIDSVIDVLFFQLSYKDSNYQNQVLMQAGQLVKSAFLCYVDPSLDLDFVIATIVATRNSQEKPSAAMFAKNGIRASQFKFNAREKQIFVSQMGRGCESHAFVKLLRCAIMGYKALSSTPDEYKKIQKKQNNFLKWMTQYFTLIYIVKNDQLTSTMVDEINPLVFVDMIVELLYHHIDSNQPSSKNKDFPSYKGSAVALKTMIRFLRNLYGDAPNIFRNLEIVSILIKRICNQVQEPRKNLAINIAIRILIKELPSYAVEQHSETLMGRLFLILNQSSDSVVKSIEERVRPNIDQLFEALGMYEICMRVNTKSMSLHFNVIEMLKTPDADKNPHIQFFIETLDRLLQNLLCTQEVTQEVAMDFIQLIASRNDVKVCELLRNLPHQKYKDKLNWSRYIFEQEILVRATSIFEMYKSGYGQIQQLISYLNIVKFYLKFEEGSSIRDHVPEFLRIADCVILLLEDECIKLDSCQEPQAPNRHQSLNQSISITRIAKRYNKLERVYQAYNKEHDPYTHTLHPHQVFNSHFFEVSQQAKEEQVKEEIEAMKQQQAYPVIFSQARSFGQPNAAEESPANRILRPQETQQLDISECIESQRRIINTFGGQNRIRDLISERVGSFIVTMFGPNQGGNTSMPQQPNTNSNVNQPKVHDVSNNYMRNLYEIYPNVRLHTEMICKCMELLCEISSHDELAQNFANYLDQFYNHPQPKEDPRYADLSPSSVIDLSESSLKTLLDFYIVEIKAKIICVFFKFFQRDEKNIQKMSKRCMKKLLQIQVPYRTPAFPNRILRDCVRPILISIAPSRQQIQQFQHLGRIIKVLHNYFTQGLGHAILSNLQDLQKSIREEYRFHLIPPTQEARRNLLMQQSQYLADRQQMAARNQAADGSQPGAPGNARPNGETTQGGAPNQNQDMASGQWSQPPINFSRENIEREIISLVEQHNVKVQKISCAVGIINTLHLFYQRTDNVNNDYMRMTSVVRQLLDFQKYLVEEFREHFEAIFEDVLRFLPAATYKKAQNEIRQMFFDKLNPLTCKVGFLQSDILQGLEKFYNKNVYHAQKILWNTNENNRELTDMILEILNRKENYCIRQTLSLDIVLQDYDQRGARRGDFSQSFINLISQVYSYSKFYPHCLKHQNNTDILDILREKWLNKDTPRNMTPQMVREIYMKIQKTLVIYCKNESADTQILFDLLKDFFCQIQLDLKPLVTLCTIDIPQHASISRQKNIMEIALTKIRYSTTSYEAKYYMFEFAFMPLALTCASDKRKFDKLFEPRLIQMLIETFFDRVPPANQGGREQWAWQKIQSQMEKRQKINYQSFFTEIIKVLIIIMRHIDSFSVFTNCAQNVGRQGSDVLVHIIKFLADAIKTANDLTLQSYAFYAITCFSLRLLGLPVDGKGSVDDQSVAQQNPNERLNQQLFTLLRESVQNPLLQLELDQEFDSSFKNISKRLNDLTTLEKQRQMAYHTEKLNQQYFKVHNRTLIENTFANLQRIFEDPRVQSQIRHQVQQSQQQPTTMRLDDQWSSFKRQFSLRPAMSARVALCQLIGNTAMLSSVAEPKLMDFNELNQIKCTYERVNRRIEKTVRQYLFVNEQPSDIPLVRLRENEQILSLIETMFNWITQLDRQYKAQVRLCQEQDVPQQQLLRAQQEYTLFTQETMQRPPDFMVLIFYKLFLSQLNKLDRDERLIQHIKAQAEDSAYEAQNELLEFVQNCFNLAQKIFHYLPQKKLDMKHDRPNESLTKEKLALKTTFVFNLLSMSIKSNDQAESNKRILTDFLQNTCVPLVEINQYPNYNRETHGTPFIEKNYKPLTPLEKSQQKNSGGFDQSSQVFNLTFSHVPQPAHPFSEQTYQVNMILHPIHVIIMAIKNGKKQEGGIEYLRPFLKQAMWYDIRRALDRDLSLIQKQLVQYFFHNHKQWRSDDQTQSNQVLNQNSLIAVTQQTILKNIKSSVQEEQKTIQKCIPHFSIRMISKMEELVREGVLTTEEFEQWVDADMYKEVLKIIQQVVHAFKLVVCSDKSMNKTINKVINQPLQSNGIPYPTQKSGDSSAEGKDGSDAAIDKTETFADFEFKDDMTEFNLRLINQDIWMKESIMLALKSITRRMKLNMNQEDILVTHGQLKLIFKSFYFESMKTCDYILEQLYDVVKYLVEDQPEQRVRLNAKEKLNLLNRLTQVATNKQKDNVKVKPDPNSIINRVCTLFLDFLEKQTNVMSNEFFMRHFDRLFMLNLLCSHEIRQRQFAIFEKFFGSSLKAKIFYFFNKLSLVNKPGQDNFEQYKDNANLKDLLELTLFNFNEDVSLQKIKNSTNLCPLSNKQVKLEGVEQLTQTQDGLRIRDAIKPFYSKYKKYVSSQQSSLKNLMQPLIEIIRINPEHNIQDKNIAEKIFSKVFWQYWQILDRPDQQYLAEAFNKVFLNFIRFTSMLQSNAMIKQQFARTLLEQVASLKEPQVRIEPEVLQYMGKHFNLWHVSIPLLEDHVQLYSQNERYIHGLQELYNGLMEEDLSVGLSRIVTRSPEMRSMYTFSQHHQWEQINSLFGQYINFYAEQEGLLKYLEHAQEMPGKYSRQLAKTYLIDMINGQTPQPRQAAQPQQSVSYDMVFDNNPDITQKLKNRQFPRPGGNRNISDIDLRSWENLYMTSLKILKKSDLFKDVADNMNRFELSIEDLWQKKDSRCLVDYLSRVLHQQNSPQQISFTVSQTSLQRVRYHMYYSYVLSEQIVDQRINQEYSRNLRSKLDENYHITQNLALRQITENLPSYIDGVQNEYFILFQQILESQEGICNMLLEHDRRNYNDLRNMMNIWRERLPHKCETIQTWQDVLENRRFIFQLLLQKNHRQLSTQRFQAAAAAQASNSGQANGAAGQANAGAAADANQAPARTISSMDSRRLMEQVDVVWINLKLAEVSRKHGMPNLAQHYQAQCKPCFINEGKPISGELFKLEQYKMVYEKFKLKMTYCNEEVTQHDCLLETQSKAKSPDFAPWQQAELLRIIGEHYLSKGKIHQANEHLMLSIEKNKREAKTWLAYAKLNAVLFKNLEEEKSALNCLKGYFCAMTLNQHKARLIIPHVFKILKQKSILDAVQQRQWQQSAASGQQPIPTGQAIQPGAPTGQAAAGQPPVPGATQATNARSVPGAPTVTGQPGPSAPAGQPPISATGQKLNFLVTKGVAKDMPKWLWIFWLPQVLSFLTMPKDDTLPQMCRIICHYMCVLYPQVTWYPLKAITEYHRDTSGANRTYDQMCRKIMENTNKKLFSNIVQVINELHKISSNTKDIRLIATLKRILNFSDHLQQKSTTERLWKNYIRQMYQIGLVNDQPEVKSEWERLIQNEETNEKQQLEQIKILKNIKDYLLIQNNMRDQDIYLQEESPYLASFPQRGIELPGQYVLKEVEPRPENVIIIERMGTTIQRSGHKEKKINFRCTNGKNYYFTMSTFSVKEFKTQLQLERVTQLKVVSNMILKRHKESARRGIKFYTAPQVLTHFKPAMHPRQQQQQRSQPSQFNRLVQDDKTFGDLQETHDYLLQERGLDPDMALLLQVQHVQDLYDSKPEDEREFSKITEAQIQHLNRECYTQMRKEVKPHLLSSYFHRIFSNVDNMFIFKKQFTKYHAINSFFTYVFNQVDKQELSSLSFCKATGQINVQQANLRHALHLYKEISQATSDGTKLNFAEIEADIFRVPVKPIPDDPQGLELDQSLATQRQQKVDFYVPFRITPNIEQFIGKIGIQGLFAGVLTSASLALSAQKEKTSALVELLLSEEFREFKTPTGPMEVGQQQKVWEMEAKKHADFCLYKITSLSEHKKVIEQQPKQEESKAGPPGVRAQGVEYDEATGQYILGGRWRVPKEFLDLEMDRPDIPEEFNKKVFTLIEMATDDTRRCQKSINWCPWF